MVAVRYIVRGGIQEYDRMFLLRLRADWEST